MRRPGSETPESVVIAIVAVSVAAVALVALNAAGSLQLAFAVALITLAVVLGRHGSPPDDG
jgi:hypothetical protein